MSKCTIQIISGGRQQEPAVVEGVTWETARMGEPGKLVFTCVKDRALYSYQDLSSGSTSPETKFYRGEDALSFSEGDKVIFYYDDEPVFSGFVFEKRRNKDHHIEVTCYDQLRYFKNKENYVFKNVRLDQIVRRIAEDLGMQVGEISNTEYVIPTFLKEDMTFFDIIHDAIFDTCMATGQLYCLYVDYDKICLKPWRDMLLPIMVDQDTAEDFDYATSIDSNTYNQVVVKCSSNNSNSIYTLNDDGDKANNRRSTQEQWGVLQTVVDVDNPSHAKLMAELLLKNHNHVNRTLTINGQFGDIRVRGGSGVFVNLDLGDIISNFMMMVEKVTHTFNENDHFMDLTLLDGRGFYGF